MTNGEWFKATTTQPLEVKRNGTCIWLYFNNEENHYMLPTEWWDAEQTEPQIECENCKHYGTHHPCELDFKACRYEPKDEPQTPMCETCRCDEPNNPKCDECIVGEDKPSNYEPQTDCPWK